MGSVCFRCFSVFFGLIRSLSVTLHRAVWARLRRQKRRVHGVQNRQRLGLGIMTDTRMETRDKHARAPRRRPSCRAQKKTQHSDRKDAFEVPARHSTRLHRHEAGRSRAPTIRNMRFL